MQKGIVMDEEFIFVGVLVDEYLFILEELVCVCGVSEDWLYVWLSVGLFVCCSGDGLMSCFGSCELVCVCWLLVVEQDFDVNQELVVFVVDFVEEVCVLCV